MSTYHIKYKCPNCSEIFAKQLERGVAASGHAGECPKCGCHQGTVGQSGQKIGVFPIVNESKPPKSELEILLEKFF